MTQHSAVARHVGIHAHPIKNRIRHCFPDDLEEAPQATLWHRLHTVASEAEAADIEIVVWSKRVTQHAEPANPTQAGLRAVDPDEARVRAYYSHQLEERLTALRTEFEERLGRLEATVAARGLARRRGDAVLGRLLGQLRETTEDEEEISLEEEVELWREMVDFSTLDKGEE